MLSLLVEVACEALLNLDGIGVVFLFELLVIVGVIIFFGFSFIIGLDDLGLPVGLLRTSANGRGRRRRRVVVGGRRMIGTLLMPLNRVKRTARLRGRCGTGARSPRWRSDGCRLGGPDLRGVPALPDPRGARLLAASK